MKKIKKLLEISRQVILDCALENGGIVAANSTKGNFPSNAKNYFYVWPRDAAYVCIACELLGINEVAENFFNWCFKRAEDFEKEGLFYEKYYPNGLKALSRFQPDQTGSVLFALSHFINNNPEKKETFQEMIEKAANGICHVWDKNHFTINTNDLWEERLCFPDLKESFTYSLAACIKGLSDANTLFPNKIWLDVATEMELQLKKHYMGFFVRSFGDIPDKRIDASVLGLVFPFEIYNSNDERVINSIKELEKRLNINGGIHRYEHDEYDGWMLNGKHRKKGAGAWPLLNFWLSICYVRSGDNNKALQYYNWVLDKIGSDVYMPEQIFENDIQVSVSPLLWSHVMFVIASHELGLL
ncbi:glycoside hydrolase family 15 protein [uncultured Desulfobacter sp.]|uniref:glycoside hydrolase family 15 protein n=1 Tax=uncultured Desulfobacter sp. TaxID=240139 RepID=UPI0029F5298F|nr:glycoside hydrolase family 15 protein [uncultured Desulfobacter sp.]